MQPDSLAQKRWKMHRKRLSKRLPAAVTQPPISLQGQLTLDMAQVVPRPHTGFFFKEQFLLYVALQKQADLHLGTAAGRPNLIGT
ncbi:hypothetical protein Y1Q_0015990 [Alligator mississippiensis]|uniref:Uncharacterized protein n=1 Tax=Alligator mississippiensis TaxID=8496 RepID=A0A151MV85_ALLMI|nr:hypothetical protein Y1Q_0015990 [Alligator mississippiensis]